INPIVGLSYRRRCPRRLHQSSLESMAPEINGRLHPDSRCLHAHPIQRSLGIHLLLTQDFFLPMPDTSDTIRKVEFWPVDVPITDPFVVATGARTVAENVFLRITLANGAQGYGEAAPFPEVGGETRESCLRVLHQLGKAILGRSAADYKEIGLGLSEQALTHPAARCGLETAVIDAYCRVSNIPMWQLWGGADVR